MKEKIKKYINKEKILKVIHVIGYIAIALLILIFTIVGVNSCNTNTNNTEIKNKTPLMTINNNDDKLYLRNDIVGNYKFTNYLTYNFDINELLDFTEFFSNNYSSNLITPEYAFSFRIYGVINDEQILLNSNNYISKLELNSSIQLIEGYENKRDGTSQLIFSCDLGNYQLYSYFFVGLTFQIGDFYVVDNLFKYIRVGEWLNKDTNSWVGAFNYVLPPYIVFDIDKEPFYINVGFTFADNTYCAIQYNNGNLYFIDGYGDNLPLTRKYSLDGEQYIFYASNEYLEDNVLTFTSFGSYGEQWLRTNLLNRNNPVYNGIYYFNERYLFDYIHRYDLPSSHVLNYPLTFYSNGEFFTNIIINILSMDNSDSVLVHLIYSNNDVRQVSVIFKYFSLSTLQWEKRDTDVLKKEYYTIELKDTILTTENYSLFRSFYYVEYIKVEYDNGGGNIGNVFILIGDSFNAILPILGITILPGITLGMLILVPFVITIVIFVVWLFKR